MTTTTTLAETILRGVPKSIDGTGVWLDYGNVLDALAAAMDPALSERAGEVLDSLAVLADMADLFSAPLLDDDDKPEMTVALERIVAAVPALLAQNAALRAERDEHAEALKVNNAVLCAALLRAKDAEAQIAALPAATVGVPLKQIGTGLYEQPAPNPAAIREAWEKAYWRMRSYAVHDNDCKLNKPPHFDGPCSCGLTAALEDALALIQMEEQK